jgi:hypothetical protein
VEELSALSPLIQMGFAGFALLQLVVLVWLVREFLAVMRAAINAIPPLVDKVQSLETKVEETHAVSERVRDRMLEFHCPFRSSADGQPNLRTTP